MVNIIKVVFLPKRKSPKNLKNMEYFVETNNEEVAHDKALTELNNDLFILSAKFKVNKKELLHYFNDVEMTKINII